MTKMRSLSPRGGRARITVSANCIGHYEFTAAQLKPIHEVITLIVFCVFSVLYLKEELKWNYLVRFGMMISAVFFVVKDG